MSKSNHLLGLSKKRLTLELLEDRLVLSAMSAVESGPLPVGEALRVDGTPVLLNAPIATPQSSAASIQRVAAASVSVPLDVELREDFMDPTAAYFELSHDRVPNFCQSPTHVSVRDGNWSDPAVWARGEVPTSDAIVRVSSHIVYDQLSDVKLQAVGIVADSKLEFSQIANTRLRVGTLMVLRDGELEIGSDANPLPADIRAEVIIADQALDLDNDPKQFGTGLLVLNGKITIHGAPLAETFMRFGVEPMSGDRSILLANPVPGWQVGDLLVLPDTRIFGFEQDYDQRETVTIAAIDETGTTISLEQPVQFDHLGARDPNGNLLFLPHVANLSRNIVFRSENPAGTRGHALFADEADVDVNDAAFIDFGRTAAKKHLDNTVIQDGEVKYVGTNQNGRYALHLHHVRGPAGTPRHAGQFRLRGNVVQGSPKWGIVMHDAHYGLVEKNIVVDAVGAGIVTEQGNETGNKIQGNLVFGSNGSGGSLLSREGGVSPRIMGDGSPENPFRTFGDIGHEGVGIWMHGANNYIRDNVVANTRSAGLVIWSRAQHKDRSPIFPGADVQKEGEYRDINVRELRPFDFNNNEIYAIAGGMRFDGTASELPMVIKNTTIWHSAGAGIDISYSKDFEFDGLTMIGHPLQTNTGFQQTFVRNIKGRNWNIQNFMVGAVFSSAFQLEDSYFNNRIDNIRVEANLTSPLLSTIRNVRYGVSEGQPSTTIAYRWNPETQGRSHLTDHTVLVYDHNGVAGDNFQLFMREQRPDFVVPSSGMGPEALEKVQIQTEERVVTTANIRLAPVPGLTNRELFEQFGVALAGRVVPADAVTRSDMVGFLAEIPEDLQAPAIELKSVHVIHHSPTSVTIEWTTDEPANSVIEYEATESTQLNNGLTNMRNGLFLPADNRLVRQHRMMLTDLEPDKQYAFRMYSTDASGNTVMTGDTNVDEPGQIIPLVNIFRTLPEDPSESAIAVGTTRMLAHDITTTSARVKWFTDQAVTTQMEVMAMGSPDRFTTVPDLEFSIGHEMVLNGLKPGTQYGMRTLATSQDGEKSVGTWRFFSTLEATKLAIAVPEKIRTTSNGQLGIEYYTTGDIANVAYAAFSLDDGETRPDVDFSGSLVIESITAGPHVLHGWLVDTKDNQVPGTDVTVAFSVIPEVVTKPTSDFNQDGVVDGLDLDQWQSFFGIDGRADADADSDSDGNDFLVWQRQFHQPNMLRMNPVIVDKVFSLSMAPKEEN